MLWRDTPCNSQDALGAKLKFGEEKCSLEGIIQKGELHERNPSASSLE